MCYNNIIKVCLLGDNAAVQAIYDVIQVHCDVCLYITGLSSCIVSVYIVASTNCSVGPYLLSQYL
jgi:hypothetical protein